MPRLRHVGEGIPLLLFALAAASRATAAAAAPSRPISPSPSHVILILIDRLDLPDLLNADAPALKALLRKGAVGLITPKMSGQLCSANAYATLCAGTPDRLAGERLTAGTQKLERVLRRSGKEAQFWDLTDLRLDDMQTAIPATIAPFTSSSLTIYTSERWLESVPTKVTGQRRSRRLAIMEAFAAGANTEDNVYVFVVLTSREPKRYFPRLTPIIIAGPGFQPGLLTTPTTRQPGLVTLSDIAPTMLERLNVPVPSEMTGRAMTVVPSANPVAMLKHLDQWTRHRDKLAVPVVTLIGVLQGLSGLLAIPLLFHPRRALVERVAPLAQFMLLAGLATPLAALIVSPFVTRGRFFTLAMMTLVSLAVGGGLLALLRCEVKGLAVLSAGVALTILVDALRGGPWTTWSIMGNAFTTGGRFYGIENGHAAYLIAFAVVALGLLPAKRWIIAGAGVLPFALGLGWFGANFGGAVAAAAALWTLVLSSQGLRNRWSAGLLVVAMTAVTAAVVIGIDMLGKGALRTHLGLAFDRAVFENPALLVEIAVRKWRANLEYIRFTPFNYVLLAGAVLLSALPWRPPPLARQLFARRAAFRAAMIAGLVGLWVAFFTNDSGIAMLDQMVQVLAPALVLMLLNERLANDETALRNANCEMRIAN